MKNKKIEEVFLIEKSNRLFLITNYRNGLTTIDVLNNNDNLEVTDQVCLLLDNNAYKLNQIEYIKWSELSTIEKDKFIKLEKKAENDKVNTLKANENFFLITSSIFGLVIMIAFLFGIYVITNLHTLADTFVGVSATLVVPSVFASGTYLHISKFKESSKELNKISIREFKTNLINQLSKKEG